MSYADTLVVAAVAPRNRVAALGVDVEPAATTPAREHDLRRLLGPSNIPVLRRWTRIEAVLKAASATQAEKLEIDRNTACRALHDEHVLIPDTSEGRTRHTVKCRIHAEERDARIATPTLAQRVAAPGFAEGVAAARARLDAADASRAVTRAEALREVKTALTSQSGTSAWDVVSYIEARIIELEREGE